MSSRVKTVAIVAISALAAIVLVKLLLPARPRGPEERIRAMFDAVAKAAQEREVDEVVEVLSERFTARNAEWHASRDEIRRLIGLELLRGQWVRVGISSAEIVVDGKRAKASVDALLSRSEDRGKGLGALLPGEASVHRFGLDLEEEQDGEWRVVSGTWRQIGLDEALAGPGKPDW